MVKCVICTAPIAVRRGTTKTCGPVCSKALSKARKAAYYQANKARLDALARKWQSENRHRLPGYARAYRINNAERYDASCRRYRRTHRVALAVRRHDWYLKNKHREVAKRKATLGRRCRSCPSTDATAYWSPRRDLCGTCCRRGDENGYCACGVALYKTRGHTCRPAVEKPSPLALSLWDALRFHDACEWTLDDLARAMGVNRRQLEPDRRQPELLALVRRFDPRAALAKDLTVPGHPVTLTLDTPAVRRALERMVNGGDETADQLDARAGRGAPALPRARTA